MFKRTLPSISDDGQVVFGSTKDDRVLLYWNSFLEKTETVLLFSELEKYDVTGDTPKFTQKPAPFGHSTPRKTGAFGDDGVVYRYSKVQENALPWPKFLESLRRKVEEAAGVTYNFALINVYETGMHKVAWHDDRETGRYGLKDGSPIASISLGATRKFAVREASNHKAKFSINLEDGDLVIMKGANFQEFYEHAVPAQKNVHKKRINITFRQINTQ